MPRNGILSLLIHPFQFHEKTSRLRTDSSVLYNVCRWFSKVTYPKILSSTVYNPCFHYKNTNQVSCYVLLYTALLARCVNLFSFSFLRSFYYIGSSSTCLWLPCCSYFIAAQVICLGLCSGYYFSKFQEDLYETRYCTHNTKEIKQYFISFWFFLL